MTSISVFTYCSMVPCNWRAARKTDKTQSSRHRGARTASTHEKENKEEYQAFDNLKQLLHHDSDALVSKETADGLEVRRANKVPVGAVYVGVGDVQGLGGKKQTGGKDAVILGHEEEGCHYC